MLLKTQDAYFRLTLAGYLNEEAQGDPLDDSWLRVRVDAACPQGAWSLVDPCLTVEEAARLAHWLKGLETGRSAPAISFLEPALLFQRSEVNGAPALRVHFGGLVYPVWQAEAPVTRSSLYLDFPLAGLDLPDLAESLLKQLRSLPPRGTW